MTSTNGTTALANRPRAGGLERHTGDAGGSFEDMLAMGERLVETGFLPGHIRTGAQAAAIILTGRELGMPPMRALRSLSMVKGKVVESADSQLARFKEDGGHADFKKLDETTAVLWLQHPNGDEHTESFTIADAKAAGLVQAGGNYQKFPKAMLRSRAITAGLKSIGWEGAVGNYDPDEAQHFSDAPKAARAKAAPAAPKVVEPVTDAEFSEKDPRDEPTPAPAPAAKQSSTAALTLYFARLGACRGEKELNAAIDSWAPSKAKLGKRFQEIATSYEGMRANELLGVAWAPTDVQRKDLTSFLSVYVQAPTQPPDDVDILTGRPVAPPETGDDALDDEGMSDPTRND